MVRPISKSNALGKIKSSRGKIFTAITTKRTNGERRVLNCRLGVTKYVTGEGLKFDPEKKNLITVFDMQKLGGSATMKPVRTGRK